MEGGHRTAARDAKRPRRTPHAEAPAPVVGNDVVDLTAPRAAGRAADRRFVERVFTAEERDAIARAADPDLALWHGWAAKEAAYKVVSRVLDEPPPFVHRAFEVSWVEPVPAAAEGRSPPPSTPVRRGQVRYGDVLVSLWARVLEGGGALHALALPSDAPVAPAPPFSPARPVHPTPPERLSATVDRLGRPGAPWNLPLDRLRSLLTERECDAVHSLPSAAVRLGARDAAARLLGAEAARVEIVCRPGPMGRRPPIVLLDGAPAALGISLSHDGPWIAWALLPHATEEP